MKNLTIQVVVPISITFVEDDFEGSDITWDEFVNQMLNNSEEAKQTFVDECFMDRGENDEYLIRTILEPSTEVTITLGEE